MHNGVIAAASAAVIASSSRAKLNDNENVAAAIPADLESAPAMGPSLSSSSSSSYGSYRETDPLKQSPGRSSGGAAIPSAYHHHYGTVPHSYSPERTRRESPLSRVPEEDLAAVGGAGAGVDDDTSEEDEEWELEQNGLYKGSYSRLLYSFSLVPLGAGILLIFLGILPILAWPLRLLPPMTEDDIFLPFPLPEFLLAASLWSLAHLLRVPIYNLSSLIPLPSAFTLILSTLLHAIIATLLRVLAMPLLGLRGRYAYALPDPHDHHGHTGASVGAFRSVWYLALAWAATEAAVGIVQSYTHIRAYRDVLVPEGRVPHVLAQLNGGSPPSPGSVTPAAAAAIGVAGRFASSPIIGNAIVAEMMGAGKRSAGSEMSVLSRVTGAGGTATNASVLDLAESEVEEDLDQLMAVKVREELEEVYGMPVIKIPIFISLLQRLDAILLSEGLTLIIGAAYLRGTLHLASSALHVWLAALLVGLITFGLSLLHSALLLPRLGLHVAAYVGALVGLGSFFAGLISWGALS